MAEFGLEGEALPDTYLFCAARNAPAPRISPALYCEADDATLRKLPRSPQFRWLDKAAMIPPTAGGASVGGPWSVCSVTQVEEVKCLIRIAPFFAAGVIFNAIIAQLTTVFIEQGATMEGRIGGGFEMPPGSMQVFTALAAAVFAPAYDYVLVPAVRKRTGRARGLTTLQRMGSGIALSIVAMAVAAIVEKKRLSAAAAESSPELIDVPFSTLPISIFWLVPQYAILGIALVFAIVGQMDFFYSEVSDGMRSVGISLPLVCRGLGNYVSTLLVTIVDRHLGWIPANLNRAHLDYFYWLLAALMAATLAFYVVAAHFYTYLHDDGDGDECRKHKEVGLTPPNKTLNPKP